MIIAIKENDSVVLGYSNRDLWLQLLESDHTDPENVAIKYAENGTLFAFTYTDRASDILLYNDTLMETEINMKALIRDVVPFMKEELKDARCIKDGSFGNALIIYQNGHLYDISPTFSVTEIDDYVCHGYRASYAQGILDLTKNMKAKDRIIEAFSYFSRATNQNMFPLVITDTKTKKFKTVYKGDKKWAL